MADSNNKLFTLNVNEAQNKYLTSSRTIKMGEAIFTEDTLIFGPNLGTKSAICLGCGINVDGSAVCYDCGWPICKEYCDKLRLHKANECEVFRKCPNMLYQRFSSKTFKFHQYDCILPLRTLLLREKFPDKWKSIEELDYNLDVRRDTPIWQNEESFVIKFIRQKCKLKQFSEELIHKVCAIIDANSFRITNFKNNIRCIYATSNYFSHDCVPNSTYVILPNEDFRIYIRAAVNIKKKERLTCSKVRPIMPTLLRRQDLLHFSFFSCACTRCADATELESHFSSLKCPKCKDEVIALNPLDFESNWKCTKCKYTKSYRSLKVLYNEIERALNKLKENTNSEMVMKTYEKLMKNYATKLHQNHAFMVYMKYEYLLHCLNGETFHESDYVGIEDKIKLLKEILHIFDIIAPGYTIIRGTTLHMLYKAYIIKAKKYNTANAEEQEDFSKYMTKALNYLDLAEEIMVVEKPFSHNTDNAIS